MARPSPTRRSLFQRLNISIINPAAASAATLAQIVVNNRDSGNNNIGSARLQDVGGLTDLFNSLGFDVRVDFTQS